MGAGIGLYNLVLEEKKKKLSTVQILCLILVIILYNDQTKNCLFWYQTDTLELVTPQIHLHLNPPLHPIGYNLIFARRCGRH